jgi:nucleoside-diphosphate-sugar epimerase
MASPSRALITGISGFTGQHLARRLKREGWEVFGLTDAPGAAHFPCLVADMKETARIAEWIGSVRPSHVIHLAAVSHVVGPALRFYEVNVLGTESLLHAIGVAGVIPSKVLIASSANIYGQTSASPIGEDDPPRPANHYAVSKAAMEWVVAQYYGRFPIVLTRPFNYTGPGQSEAFLFAKLAGAFHRREPLLELGNVRVSRDLSDISFVIEAYYRLLLSSFTSDVVNVCSGRSVSVADALAILRGLTGHDPEIRVDPALLRDSDIEVLTGNPGRLQTAIGPLEPVRPEKIFSRMLTALAKGIA